MGYLSKGLYATTSGGGTGGSPVIGTITPPEGYIKPMDTANTIAKIFDVLTIAAVILAVGFVIYSGIKYIMSSGDAAKIKEAQATITYAIIGLGIAIAGRLIVLFVYKTITGTDVPELPNP